MSDPVYAAVRAGDAYRREASPETEAALREALWGAREIIDDELRKRIGLRSVDNEQAIQRAYADAYGSKEARTYSAFFDPTP